MTERYVRGRSNNLNYAEDTDLLAETPQNLKKLVDKIKQHNPKTGFTDHYQDRSSPGKTKSHRRI